MRAQIDSATAVVFVLIAAASLVSMIATLKIDDIINGNLYRHGLQFSIEWAIPYWTMTGTVFAMGWFIIIASIVFELRLFMHWRHRPAKPESPSSHRQPVQKETPQTQADSQRKGQENKPEPTTLAMKTEAASNENEEAELNKVETTALAVKTEGASTEVGVLLEKLSELEERVRTPKPVEKKREQQTS
jgi:hypothetical protein